MVILEQKSRPFLGADPLPVPWSHEVEEIIQSRTKILQEQRLCVAGFENIQDIVWFTRTLQRVSFVSPLE